MRPSAPSISGLTLLVQQGKDLSHDLKSKKDNNMTAANFYAVMNILSAAWSLIPVLLTEV